jgi:hypothetical protein
MRIGRHKPVYGKHRERKQSRAYDRYECGCKRPFARSETDQGE